MGDPLTSDQKDSFTVARQTTPLCASGSACYTFGLIKVGGPGVDQPVFFRHPTRRRDGTVEDSLMSVELPLQAAVFDLDGLMFNTEDLYVEIGTQILRRRGREFSKSLLDAMMGRPSPVALQIMIDWHQLGVTVAELESETDALFPAVLDARLQTMPGLLELLAALEQAGIAKAVATSSRLSFVTDVLSRFDLLSRFAFLLTAENVTRGKPDPEIYQKACARLGLEPVQVMVLEDSENGCRAAVAAGAYAVAVPGQQSQTHDFSGCRFRAESLADRRIYQALGISPPTSS